MYDYETFKEIVKKELPSYFPEVKDLKIEENAVYKVNEKKDSLTISGTGISKAGENNSYLAPTVYFDDMYENYKSCDSIEVVLEDLAERLTRVKENHPDFNAAESIMNKGNVYFQLINTEANKEMLADMPHREYLDMSIIYRSLMYRTEDGISSVRIDNDVMKRMDLTEEELYDLAYKNTETLFPVEVNSMFEMMASKMPPEIAEIIFPEPDNIDEAMYVITNNNGINGAAAMLYTEPLDILSERFGADLYILPSSVHEVIAVSAEVSDLEYLSETVRYANTNEVKAADYLSDNVYRYNRQEKKLTQETDVQKKKEPEQQLNKEIKRNRTM